MQDGAVYKGDVEDLCGVLDEKKTEKLLEEDFSLVEVPAQGTDSLNFSLEQVHHHQHQQQLHPHHQHHLHYICTISIFSERRLKLTVRLGVSSRSRGTSNLTIHQTLLHGRSIQWTTNIDNETVLEPNWSDNLQALVLLVPMRLGAESLNPIYASCLKVFVLNNPSFNLNCSLSTSRRSTPLHRCYQEKWIFLSYDAK